MFTTTFFSRVLASSMAFSLVASAQSALAQDVITLKPKLSIPAAEFAKIEEVIHDASAQILVGPDGSSPDADIQVLVQNPDNLSSIVERLWGPEIKTAGVDYANLIRTLRSNPLNKPITARSNSGLDIRPGDTLYLPRVIGDRRKTGTLVVKATTTETDPLSLQVAKASLINNLQKVTSTVASDGTPTVATLADIETCPAAQSVRPFASERLLDHLTLVKKRQGNIQPIMDGQIAVIDSAIGGNISLLMPLMFRSQNDDPTGDDGYGFNVPKMNSRLSSLVSNYATPRKHGTHVVSLAFGGPDWLAARPWEGSNPGSKWKLVPIVVQDEAAQEAPLIKPYHINLAINHAANPRHVKIVNMSVEAQGIGYLDQIINTGERGARLYVVAAGNGQLTYNAGSSPASVDYESTLNLRKVRYSGETYWVLPAMRSGNDVSNVITVAAHDEHGKIAAFSGFSDSVDIAALGVCVQGFTRLGNSFEESKIEGISGTSQATALVTFGASLVADILGGYYWSPSDIKTRLLASSIYDVDLRDKVSSSGRLSIERAVAARFDILRYKDPAGKIVDAYGDLGDFPGNKKDSIDSFHICSQDWKYTLRQVRKVVRRGMTKEDARFDFVASKMTGPVDTAHPIKDPFLWRWDECPANWGNFNQLRFNPVTGPPIDVKFADIVEIIPRQVWTNQPR